MHVLPWRGDIGPCVWRIDSGGLPPAYPFMEAAWAGGWVFALTDGSCNFFSDGEYSYASCDPSGAPTILCNDGGCSDTNSCDNSSLVVVVST